MISAARISDQFLSFFFELQTLNYNELAELKHQINFGKLCYFVALTSGLIDIFRATCEYELICKLVVALGLQYQLVILEIKVLFTFQRRSIFGSETQTSAILATADYILLTVSVYLTDHFLQFLFAWVLP